MRPARPAPLRVLLAITFLGSVSSGVFWSGIFFVTAARYRFSPARNLVLAAAMGAIYALAARFTGPVVRAAERRFGARGTLAFALCLWALSAGLPALAGGSEAALWAAALVGSSASAAIWPIVESYLTAGRHGAEMRSAIGWFNVTWTPATAVPLLVMPLLSRVDPLATLLLSAAVNVVAVLLLPALPPQPAAHSAEDAAEAVGPDYPALLRATSWLLPISYVVSSTVVPVLPHRLAAVGVQGSGGSQIAALWMVSRFVVLALMWRVGFWHGRWSTLALSAAALAGGMFLVLLAPSLPLLIVGLVAFGAGMALTYYASLYYSMSVGHAAVDAGGSFEALIGVGYGVGPVLGLAGHAVGQAAQAEAVTVALVSLLVLAASAAAVRAWLGARAARREG